MSKRYPPEDPREWLNRARSNLVLGRWISKQMGEPEYLWQRGLRVKEKKS